MPEDFAPALGRFHAVEPLTLLSVVLPVRNEGPNILPLVAEIHQALAGQSYEIVYVDDGSRDDTGSRLAEAAAIPGAPLRWLRHRVSCGQSAAILIGVRVATGVWIATLDGDGQNDPADIPALLKRAVATEGRGANTRAHRRRALPTTGQLNEAACVPRCQRASWASSAGRRGGHRLRVEAVSPRGLPRAAAFRSHAPLLTGAVPARRRRQVVTIPVNHRPRTRGRSNYGTLDRLWVGVFDLVGVWWLQRRWSRPEAQQPAGEIGV